MGPTEASQNGTQAEWVQDSSKSRVSLPLNPNCHTLRSPSAFISRACKHLTSTSYASQTPRSINHLKDELIISELLRHAEGQADKFSLHSGEVFLWLGDRLMTSSEVPREQMKRQKFSV